MSQSSCLSISNSSVDNISEVLAWHYRLGHPNFMDLEKLFPYLFLNKSSSHCEICQMAKHTRTVYQSTPYTPSKLFALIHSDIWWASRIKNINDALWFVLFIDDHTTLTWVFLMREKPEVWENFQSLWLHDSNTKTRQHTPSPKIW